MSEPKPVLTGEQGRMTGIHLCALQITIQKMVDGGEEEYTGGLREVLSLLASIVSGETVNVKRSEIDSLHRMTLGVDGSSTSDVYRKAHDLTARWLATPATQEDR